MLLDEVVWEFDGYSGQSRAEADKLTKETVARLVGAGYDFIVFDHGGKSPHVHAWVDGLAILPDEERVKYKEALVKRFAADSEKVDLSLCASAHLIALEYAPHWKYGTIKRELLSRLGLSELEATWTPCARCGVKPCGFVDVRGAFYCSACGRDALKGVLR